MPGSRLQRHQDAQPGRQRSAVGRRAATDHVHAAHSVRLLKSTQGSGPMQIVATDVKPPQQSRITSMQI